MSTNTVHLHRVLTAKPEKIYRAFLDRDAMAQVTVTLKKVSLGTEMTIVQEGLPTVIPLEACYVGWQQSLNNLAKLVEPEIPE